MNAEHLTVSELNNFIKHVIQSGFPQALWVCGEIQQFNRNRSKRHIFFELVEKDASSKDIKARIGLVIFAGVKDQIDRILKKSENAFELKDDIEVKFSCRVDFYAPHGVVRLIVESIDPVYTLGKLAQEKQKLISELKKQGTLDKNKQRALPVVPLRIALITSHDSAAYNDFCSEIEKAGIAFKVFVRNTLMQGKNAEADIVKAIGVCEKLPDLDVLIITRGGGSLSDLSCFDSRLIAQKIANCPLPVLSGIGHEINLSITDMAAHTYEKTPTAIAQFLVARVRDFIATLDQKRDEILNRVNDKIARDKQCLRQSALTLQQGTLKFLKDHHARLVRLNEKASVQSLHILKNQRQKIAGEQQRLMREVDHFLSQKRTQMNHVTKIIDVVHPSNTLKRGFSITRDQQGRALKSSAAVMCGQDVLTQLADGQMISHIKEVKKGESDG